VLPILAHIDSLSITELDQVRSAFRRDLASLPGKGFGLFADGDEDDDRSKTPTPDGSTSYRFHDPPDPRPLTPASTVQSQAEVQLPFAIFSPENSGEGTATRRFPWGEADVFNPDHCDFAALRDAILTTHIKVSYPASIPSASSSI
jgi:septin family protein